MVLYFLIFYISLWVIGGLIFLKKWFFPGKVDMTGKTVVITGGSSGTGYSVAQTSLDHGAKFVFIIARNKVRLEQAAANLKKKGDQEVIPISVDVSDYDELSKAFEEIKQKSGKIHYLFNCAGFARPGLLSDATPQDFKTHIDVNYLGAAYCSKLAVPMMPPDSHIMFCGSACSLLSFAGYVAYSPAKYALHGLADTLRNELLPLKINVHMGFISSIDSPGFVEENKVKPKVCAEIEGHANLYSTQQVADHIFRCIGNNEYFLVLEPITYAMQQAGCGVAPSNNFILDLAMYPFVIVARLWGRKEMDDLVMKYHKKESKEL